MWRARLVCHEPLAAATPNVQRKSRFGGTSPEAKGAVESEARWWGIGDLFNVGCGRSQPCGQLCAPELFLPSSLKIWDDNI